MADTEQPTRDRVTPEFLAIRVGAYLKYRVGAQEFRNIVTRTDHSPFDPAVATVDTARHQGIEPDQVLTYNNPNSKFRFWHMPPGSYVTARPLDYLTTDRDEFSGTVVGQCVLPDADGEAVIIRTDDGTQEWVYLHQIVDVIAWRDPSNTMDVNDARELAGRMLAFFTAHPHMHNQHAWVATADALTPPVDTGESDEASPYLPSVDEATPEQKQTHLCDTTLCAAGLAAYLSGYRLHPGNTVVTSYASLPGNPTAHLSIEDEAAKLLKLSTGARREMFSGATSESYVITMLRRLYLTGSVWRDGE